MFDTVAGILENGPYCPKDASRNSWEGRMRDYFDDTDNCRKTSVSQTLNRPEARILIYGDGGGIRIESSLPKLLYGNNLSTVSNAQPALKRLREFTLDYVSGDLPDLYEMRYTRVDYCHNFALGDLLPDYASTLAKCATSRTVARPTVRVVLSGGMAVDESASMTSTAKFSKGKRRRCPL